jgi:heptosyltransferase-1
MKGWFIGLNREPSAGMLSSFDPARILIVRPSALGDVCRSVPVAASLKKRWPSAHIDWLVQDGFEDVVNAHPAVDGCVRFKRKQLARWWYHPPTTARLGRFLKSLNSAQYDLVVDCQGLSRSGFFTWVTRASVRAGSRQAREAAWLGYNRRAETGHCVHTVDCMLAILETINVPAIKDMQLYISDENAAWWNIYRKELGIGDDPYVVLAPTSRWASKRWPTQKWSLLAAALLSEKGFCKNQHVVIIGAPGEQSQIVGVCHGNEGELRLHDCCGSFSVGQTMAAIESSQLVVANDSAPLHMAVGLNTPIVALFGPTDPHKVGPYGRPEAVLQHVNGGELENVNYRSTEPGSLWMDRIELDEVVEASLYAVSKGVAPRTIEEQAL